MMTPDLFIQSELLEILPWDISDTIKLKLLEYSGDEISIVGKIIQHKFVYIYLRIIWLKKI